MEFQFCALILFVDLPRKIAHDIQRTKEFKNGKLQSLRFPLAI